MNAPGWRRTATLLAVFAAVAGLGVLAFSLKLPGIIHMHGKRYAGPSAYGGWFTLDPFVVAYPWAVLFIGAFFDWRKPWQLRHLDLLALVSFWPVAMLISAHDYEPAQLTAGVSLLYLFCRLAFCWREGSQPFSLTPRLSAKWMFAAVCALTLMRLILDASSPAFLDVGEASMYGAQLVLHGHAIYGGPDTWTVPGAVGVFHGDTYGPVVYYIYAPFVAIFGGLPAAGAARVAALTFDILNVVALGIIGRRLGGPERAQTFMFTYLAYPFTAIAMFVQTNDALVAAVVLWSLVALHRPALRGILMAAAALTKFLPALVCLQLLGSGPARRRYVLAVTVSAAALMLPTLIDPGLGTFLQRTFAWQQTRGVTFSVWTYLPPALTLAGRVLLAAALLALAVSPVLWARKFELRACATLAAALLVGAQLALGYWFYAYIVWFFPVLIIALAAPREASTPDGERTNVSATSRPGAG